MPDRWIGRAFGASREFRQRPRRRGRRHDFRCLQKYQQSATRFLSPGKSRRYIPIVAHGLQNRIIELDGARDEQGRMSWLIRHFGIILLHFRTRRGIGEVSGLYGHSGFR